MAIATTSERYHVFKILQELDRGIVHHMGWLRDLHRCLICDGVNNQSPDLAADAHSRCRFGKWLESVTGNLLEDVMFQDIVKIHHEMHDATRDMLTESLHGRSIGAGLYTRFMDMAIQFKLAVRRYQAHLIEQVCVVDQVTGAWNRQAMHYRLAQEQERMARKGGTCCLSMVDLDHFKRVNDRYGHPAGDVVLRGFADLLSRCLRKYDSVFRYGGEEFLLFFPLMDQQEAIPLVERLRVEVEKTAINLPECPEPLYITASFGLACFSGERDMEVVIAEADHALMWAKADGRNCVRVWEGERRQEK